MSTGKIIIQMSNPKQIIMSCILIVTFLEFSHSQCLNNGTQLKDKGICLCPEPFIDFDCSISATHLNSTQSRLPLTSNFTFAYISPFENDIFRFGLTFCLEDEKPLIFITFAHLEERNGTITKNLSQRSEVLRIFMDGTERCLTIFSAVVSPAYAKQNGQTPKIVFGIKQVLTTNTSEQQRYIRIKCQTDSVFSIGFLFAVVMSFMGLVVFVGMVSFAVGMRRRRNQHGHRYLAHAVNNMEVLNRIMPLKKYASFIQQSQERTNAEEQVCAICLSQFQPYDQIRETPCRHVYHNQCLDSWCTSNFNCPVCRKSFNQEGIPLENYVQDMVNPREQIL